jgi:hypothetical protein
MKHAPISRQRYDLYVKYRGHDSEISGLHGECGFRGHSRQPQRYLGNVGTIEDANTLRQMLNTSHSWDTTVCLNSPGGSLTGGQALYDLFINTGTRTHLRATDRCESACALAFLGGTVWGDLPHPARSMAPGARLGFHAPRPSAEASELLVEPGPVMDLSMQIVADLLRDRDILGLTNWFFTEFILHTGNPRLVIRI